MMKRKSEDTINMFHGFWKYIGVISIFLIGVILLFWGVYLFSNNISRDNNLIAGFFSIVSIAVGIELSLMSLIEFFGMVKEDNG